MPPTYERRNAIHVFLFLWDCLKPTLATKGGGKDVENQIYELQTRQKERAKKADTHFCLCLHGAAGKSIFERIIFFSSLPPCRAVSPPSLDSPDSQKFIFSKAICRLPRQKNVNSEAENGRSGKL